MKLQKFKEKNNKQKSIIIFTIACVLLITVVFLYKTFASFQVVENEDLINGNISDPGDIYFVFYKDGTISKTMPLKNEGYAYDYEKSHCEVPGKEETKNIAIPYFDSIDWSVTVKGMSERPTKCTLYFYKGYQDENLNGADPVLERPLIPVKIDDDGTVRKADPSQKWYDYAQKQWANAVILVDETKQYEVDQEIEEKDIESYFVWIPRYRYKLKANESDLNEYKSVSDMGNVNNVEEFYSQIGGNKGASTAFEIEFENRTTSPSDGTNEEKWFTHPAFISFNSNGFWVGKFETGYNQSSDISKEITTSGWTKEKAEKNTEESNKVIIKPNVYSWRSINVSNAFYTSYNYQRELDSHMMKNSEWGAVTYLTQSEYGRCNGSTCEEVRLNNNSNFITGYSAKEESTVGSPVYNSTDITVLGEDGNNGYHYGSNASKKSSSTTENYYGIYDMSGGSWEYVMGVMKGSNIVSSPASGKNATNNSGFKGLYSNCQENGNQNGDICGEERENKTGYDWPSSKYYDLYDYSTSNQEYQRGQLGDTTKEIGKFYSVSYNKGSSIRRVGSYNADIAFFVSSDAPWFLRGAARSDGTDAGISAFSANAGQLLNFGSFRIVLTP